jgi:hypothetical protein
VRFQRPRPLGTRPSMSVVIPCYNYGHFLPSAVASALDQTGLDVEVMVVDDASTDGSAAVARRLADADPRVEVLLHEHNQGHIRTYNDGLEKARGDYVALLSADDLLAPDALTRAVSLMEHHPSVGLVYGYAWSFTGMPPEVVNTTTRSWSVWPGRDWLTVSARRGRCFLSSPEAVMRREALRQTDGYDPRLPHSGDFDMWLRTAARWDIGRVNGAVQALYRVHDANMHLTTYAGWLADLEARRTTFGILFDERAPELPEVARLRSPASRALAVEAVRRALAAHREDPGCSAVEELLAFALDTYPPVTRTAWWRLVEVGPRAGRRLPLREVRRAASRARSSLTWRRERRFGT